MNRLLKGFLGEDRCIPSGFDDEKLSVCAVILDEGFVLAPPVVFFCIRFSLLLIQRVPSGYL